MGIRSFFGTGDFSKFYDFLGSMLVNWSTEILLSSLNTSINTRSISPWLLQS